MALPAEQIGTEEGFGPPPVRPADTPETDADLALAPNEYSLCVGIALDLHDLWLDGELAAFTLSLDLVDDLAPAMRFAVLTILLDLIERRAFPEMLRDSATEASLP